MLSARLLIFQTAIRCLKPLSREFLTYLFTSLILLRKWNRICAEFLHQHFFVTESPSTAHDRKDWHQTPVATYFTHPERPHAVACARCDVLERQYKQAIGRIREVIEVRSYTLREKVRELHRGQENRDKAIEAFYAHKRTHRSQNRNAQIRNAA